MVPNGLFTDSFSDKPIVKLSNQAIAGASSQQERDLFS